jgi:hypothetical protein
MKFKVKEWERKFYPNTYKDLFYDIGVFNVCITKEDSKGAHKAVLKKAGKKISIYGIFHLEIEDKYMVFGGFDNKTTPLKYVQYRCYNL